MILASAAGKERSETFARKCVEYLAHYSLSKTHKGCTVEYDKGAATITICADNNTSAATTVEEDGYIKVSFSGTGLNDWYRALNSAGYRTFMRGHELLDLINVGDTEEIWHYLNPPLHTTHGEDTDSQSSGSTSQKTSSGAITFRGENTSCTFRIIVNYNCAEE